MKQSNKLTNQGYDASPSIGYKIANKLLFNKIKTALGIEKLSVFYTAGAPLNEDIKDHFKISFVFSSRKCRPSLQNYIQSMW